MRSLRVFFLGSLVACGTTTGAEPLQDGGSAADASDACGPVPGRSPEEGPDPTATCVKQVTGRLVDDAGMPLPKVNVTVCGNACFGALTDDTGAFRARPRALLPAGAYVVFAHARPRHGSVLLPMPARLAENVDLGTLEAPALAPEAAALPSDGAPASTVRVGALSLAVPAGVSWELSFEDATDDVDGRLLRIAKVPPNRAPAFAAGAALVFALAPFDAKASKPIALRIDDTGGLAAGAPVEIVVMDGLSLSPPNTGGLPKVVAKGHVSNDGASIVTDPGEGVQHLTWIAVRPATAN